MINSGSLFKTNAKIKCLSTVVRNIKHMWKSYMNRMTSCSTSIFTSTASSSIYHGENRVMPKNHEANKHKEIQIPVPWGHIAAKEWGTPVNGAHRVLGLHGWQDNSNTFDRLIPLLSTNMNLHFICVDFPGHGLSSHRPPGCFYYLFDYVADVRRVVNHLQWESGFSFISHSMGSGVAVAYAACFADEVDRIVLFDNVVPLTRDHRTMPSKLSFAITSLIDSEKQSLKQNPIRGMNLERAVKLVVQSMNGSVSELGARILLKRGSKPSKYDESKIIFTRDPRLKVEAVPGKTIEQGLVLAKGVHADVLAILGDQGLMRSGSSKMKADLDIFVEAFNEHCRSFRIVDVQGTHHVHLNNPERVAKYINEFFAN